MNFHLWNIPLGIIAFIVAYSAINVRSVRKQIGRASCRERV